MSKELGVYIGRFQPFHNGHLEVIKQSQEYFDHVLVLVGSSNSARSIRNPFSYSERCRMIKSCFITDRVSVKPLNDYIYRDEQWLSEVHRLVDSAIRDLPYSSQYDSIKIIGYDKDPTTSYYLKMFGDWGKFTIKPVLTDDEKILSSTDIREAYLKDDNFENLIQYIQFLHFVQSFRIYANKIQV